MSALSAKEITTENLADVLQKIELTERMLSDSQGAIDERVTSTVQERLMNGLREVACSPASLDMELSKSLFERFDSQLREPASILPDEQLRAFDDHPSWGSSKRRFGAEGLICLALKEELLEPDYKAMLLKIACDPDPVVRLLLAHRIWAFFQKWPEFVWDTLERWITDYRTVPGAAGVLQGALHPNGWLWWLRNEDTDRADRLLRNLLDAARSRNFSELRGAGGSWLAALWFFKGETWALESLDALGNSLRDNLDELNGALNVAIDVLLPRTPKEASSKEHKERALGFLGRLLQIANELLETSRDEIEQLSSSDAAEDATSWVRKIFGSFSHTATEFQFSTEGHTKQWASVLLHTSSRSLVMMKCA